MALDPGDTSGDPNADRDPNTGREFGGIPGGGGGFGPGSQSGNVAGQGVGVGERVGPAQDAFNASLAGGRDVPAPREARGEGPGGGAAVWANMSPQTQQLVSGQPAGSPLDELFKSIFGGDGAGAGTDQPIGWTSAGPTYAPGKGPGMGALGDTSFQDLQNFLGKYIPYLESPNLRSTTEGQAMYESAAKGITNKYDQAREQLKESLGAQQGMSGLLGDELEKLDEQEAVEKSNIERGFVSETGNRLAQAGQVLSNEEALARQRAAESMGIEASLNTEEQNRINEALNAMAGNPTDLTAMAGIAGNLLNDARNQQAMSMGGMSSLGQLARFLSAGRNTGGGTSGVSGALAGVDPTVAAQINQGYALGNPLPQDQTAVP